MTSQDLIYSVLPRPLGNEVSSVKSDVKEVSKTARLKQIEDDEKATEQYGVAERRKHGDRERRKRVNDRRKVIGRRASDKTQNQEQDQNKKDGGLDIYV